jgi:hypothetical protein
VIERYDEKEMRDDDERCNNIRIIYIIILYIIVEDLCRRRCVIRISFLNFILHL